MNSGANSFTLRTDTLVALRVGDRSGEEGWNDLGELHGCERLSSCGSPQIPVASRGWLPFRGHKITRSLEIPRQQQLCRVSNGVGQRSLTHLSTVRVEIL